MTEGLLSYCALCAAVCACIVWPGLVSLGLVLAVVLVIAIRPAAEDAGKRREERERS